MQDLRGMKILLIAPGFHNYISDIASAFENLGADVEAYIEEPSTVLTSNFYISRLKKFRSFYTKLYTKEIIHQNKIISNHLIGKKFDHVVIIKGAFLTDEFLINMRKSLPKARFVLYQWDSIKNYNYLDRLKHFDAVYSFDYEDCSLNREIHYLPLFFTTEYERIANTKVDSFKYDIFFLGYNHSIRVPKLVEIISFCDKKGLKYSVNLMTSISERIRLMPYRNKIKCSFYPWKFEEFSSNYTLSRAILDISSPNQTGLPIRVIEAYGAGKKIITTNYNILKEDFYDSKMIFIWGKDKPENLIEFLNSQHERKHSDKYSVNSFANQLISNNGTFSNNGNTSTTINS